MIPIPGLRARAAILHAPSCLNHVDMTRSTFSFIFRRREPSHPVSTPTSPMLGFGFANIGDGHDVLAAKPGSAPLCVPHNLRTSYGCCAEFMMSVHLHLDFLSPEGQFRACQELSPNQATNALKSGH